MNATWRERCRRWIAEALEQGRAAGLEGRELSKFVRAQTRGNLWSGGSWAVRMWREEFRYLVRGKARPVKAARPKLRPAEGQGELFR